MPNLRFALHGRDRAHTIEVPKSKANRVLGGVYGAIALARPRVVIVDASLADESSDGPELVISVRRDNPSPQPSVRFLAEPHKPAPARSASDDEAAQSSMRRVLRETEDLQGERAAWSDSAVRTVAYDLSARLAERDMKPTASPSLGEARPGPGSPREPHPLRGGSHGGAGTALSSTSEAAAAHDDRVLRAARDHSPESFLRFQEDGDTDRDDRACGSPQSFIDLGRDDEADLEHTAKAATTSRRIGEQRMTTLRSRYLSIDSTLLFNGLRAPASPCFTSDASRDSTLSAKLEDFPAPPSLGSPSTNSVAGGCFDEFGSPVLPRKSGGAWEATCPSVQVEEAPGETAGPGLETSLRPAAGLVLTCTSESAWFGSSSDSDPLP
ncbi:hypothetical protein JCM3774_006752 [Rhodotorula dairenensis]